MWSAMQAGALYPNPTISLAVELGRPLFFSASILHSIPHPHSSLLSRPLAEPVPCRSWLCCKSIVEQNLGHLSGGSDE